MILEKLAQSTRLRVEKKKEEAPFETVRRQAEALAQQEREKEGGLTFPFERALARERKTWRQKASPLSAR